MRQLTVLVTTMLMAFQVFAQNIENELTDQDWRIVPALPNNNYFLLQTFGLPLVKGDFTNGRVMVSPTETVVLTIFGKNNYSARKINSRLQVKWNTPLSATPLFIGEVNGNILIITAPIDHFEVWSSKFDAVLLDRNTGKIILEKNLFTSTGSNFCEPKLLIPASADQFYFGVRETDYRKGKAILERQMISGASSTKSFNFHLVNDKLETTRIVSIPMTSSDIFLDCGITTAGELLIGTAGEVNLRIERFNMISGNASGKLSISMDTKYKDSKFMPHLFASKVHPEKAFVTIEYTNKGNDRTLEIYQLNFTTNSVVKDEHVINKAYVKELKDTYTAIGKDAGKPRWDLLDDLSFTDLKEHNNQVIVFKEVKFLITQMSNTSASAAFFCRDGIITVYDENLKRISEQVIPKKMPTMTYFGHSSSIHIRNNKVHIISGLETGMNCFKAIHSIYNLQNSTLETYELLEKNDISMSVQPDSPVTLWFEDGYVVNYTSQNRLTYQKFKNNLQKISFQ